MTAYRHIARLYEIDPGGDISLLCEGDIVLLERYAGRMESARRRAADLIARRVATAVARPVEPFPPPLVTLEALGERFERVAVVERGELRLRDEIVRNIRLERSDEVCVGDGVGDEGRPVAEILGSCSGVGATRGGVGRRVRGNEVDLPE